MEKIMIIDTETAGGLDNPLTYDIGFIVADRSGAEYETVSLVIHNIYAEQRELMKTAYYAHKLPKYEIKLANGERKMVTFFTARKMVVDLCEKYNIKQVYAYNMGFDRRALNNTQKFTTDNKYKYFFPFGIEFCCIWHMACQVLMARPSYINFALENNLLTPKGNIATNAESCYKYLTNDLSFEEEHQGIDDVKIEKEILLACFKQHKKMDKKPYTPCWRLVQKKRSERFNLSEEEEEKLRECQLIADSLNTAYTTSARRYRANKIFEAIKQYPRLEKYILFDETKFKWADRFTFVGI